MSVALGEVARTGVDGIRTHKLRSLLTTLGIIFGVASVVAMLSIGEGAKREALEQYGLLGIANVIVNDAPRDDDLAEDDGPAAFSPGLRIDDAESLAEVIPLVSRSVPVRRIEETVRYARERARATVVGTHADFADAMHLRVTSGRFLRSSENAATARVCVLTALLARELFAFEDPIGDRVKIATDWYTVVGIVEATPPPEGGDDVIRDTSRDVYVPLSNLRHRFDRETGTSEIDQIVVEMREPEAVGQGAALIQRTLERRHNGVIDFELVVPVELLRQKQATQRIFNIVMGAIASISLLVGGIGIMNIMLASILERTREIGVRRAVGATVRDVMLQFLLEAVAVSVLGGVLGVLLGFGITRAIAVYAGWRTMVSPAAVVLAFTVSAAVGIVFGYYPARRAARLDPIESLRYE